MTKPKIRDWQPGDGIRCSYARNAQLRCGPPVKTRIQQITGLGSWAGKPPRTFRYPLCAVHAANATRATPGHSIQDEAHRIAIERLVHDHWDDYMAHRDAAIQKLIEETA